MNPLLIRAGENLLPEILAEPVPVVSKPISKKLGHFAWLWLSLLAAANIAGNGAEVQPGAGSSAAPRRLVPIALSTNLQPALRTFNLPASMPGSNASVLLRMDGAWKLHSATELAGAKVKIPSGMAVVVAEPVLKQALTKKGASGQFVLNDGRQSWDMRYEFFADPDPAVWQASSGVFTTEVHVAVFLKQSGPGPLAALPVEVAGMNAEASPSQFVFTNTGKFQVIQVSTKLNDEEASINLAPFTTNAPFIIPVRRLGGLRLACSSLRIRGYGLGTATISATRIDTKSKDLMEGPKLDLHVTSETMHLAQNLSIPQGQSTVTFKVRSTGMGTNRVLISSGSDATKQESLAFECYFPGAFLLATLLGGMVGACARFLEGKTLRRERIVRYVGEGLIAAILATAAVLAGISSSLLPAQVCDTELGAFLISASVAFTGIVSVLFLKKLGPKPIAKPSPPVD